MTIRTIFNIILKVLGLLFLKEVLVALPQLLLTFNFLFDGAAISAGALPIFLVLLNLLLYCFMGAFLIFRSLWIIDKLKLDKGFTEENVTLNVDRNTLLSVAVILIGGFLLLEALPSFIIQILSFLPTPGNIVLDPGMGLAQLIAMGIKVAIGMLLILRNKRVVNFIEMRACR